MFTCLFIFSVLLRDLFARSDPERFGHLLDTVFTLFQLLTLDDWSFIYRDSAQQGASYIIIFLMAYILIEYFTFLNLVIAVLVDNFQMSLIRRQELKKRTQRLQLQESVSDPGPTGKLLPPPSSGRAELGVGGWVSVPCWGYARGPMGVVAPQSWTQAWLRTTSGWRSWWSGWRAARGRSSCSWVTSGAWPRSSGCSRSSGPGQPRPTTSSTPSSRRPSRTSCATEGPGCQDDPTIKGYRGLPPAWRLGCAWGPAVWGQRR
ncbi:voltage-dependent T-type calcium channel subunit alpha-1I [Alligator mississippiensis]|uniref:voltage-dependent T-type calcium channel subunit alpha-1I n=1 Tax=Alligator mississippiensis TaxID=8496 RepID=UPI00287767E9|nr:voltage-dependent T-type calcium channel subunit alpha-1I [Alligator mississippiensis]